MMAIPSFVNITNFECAVVSIPGMTAMNIECMLIWIVGIDR